MRWLVKSFLVFASCFYVVEELPLRAALFFTRGCFSRERPGFWRGQLCLLHTPIPAPAWFAVLRQMWAAIITPTELPPSARCFLCLERENPTWII